LSAMQASHYDSGTNIGGGLDMSINELQSARARPFAQKVIIMMTDGKPNCDQNNNYVGDTDPSATTWAYNRAHYAADNHMTLYTVAVGADADRSITQAIASMGRGQEFAASGT